MRELITHKVNGLNEALNIVVLDDPGSGNAHHLYEIGWGGHDELSDRNPTVIKFQKGPIGEVGVNGISNEALLAIVAHRLECFQSGPYAHHWNAMALESVRGAMSYLHERTRERVERGVEGTMAK